MLKRFGLIVLFWTLIATPQALAYTEAWEIADFNSEIEIFNDGSVIVTEIILADFTNEAHRGIERSIPYKYINNYNARIKLLETNDWSIYSYKENGYFKIQLTTPDDSRLEEQATYVIKYKLDNVISFLDQADEFSWNVTGTEWVVPIKNIHASIKLPEGITPIDSICFTGEYGSTAKNCTIEGNQFQASDLAPYEGLSIALQIPTGSISPLSTFEKAIWWLQDNPGAALPVLALAIMLTLYYKKGRDDQSVSDTIMPHYRPPEGLSPTEVGTIIDEKLDPRDMTATIIDFAIRGFIEITELEDKDYELKLKKSYNTEKEFERLILEGIFPANAENASIKVSRLKNKFYTHIPKIKKSVMQKVVNDGYFPHKPSTIRAIYSGIGTALFFIGIQLGFYPSLAFGLAGSGIIIGSIGYFMPRKTKKGTETYYVLKGLYEFINTAEKDRLKFQEDNNIIFEKVLPYAMAFGIAKKWTKAFDGLIQEPPSWYHGQYNTFNMIHFSSAMNSLGSKMTSNISSRPGGSGGGSWSGGSSFGGGGFSGGGFGGGGGRGL